MQAPSYRLEVVTLINSGFVDLRENMAAGPDNNHADIVYLWQITIFPSYTKR